MELQNFNILNEKRISRITFRISDTLRERLDRHALESGVSTGELLNVISDWFLVWQEGLRRTLSDSRVLHLEMATEKLRIALADGELTLSEKAEIQPHLAEVEHAIWSRA